jgi:leader peptidase (prepilin peptidase)/N-methyltransferase
MTMTAIIDFWLSQPLALTVLCVLFGLVIGSFLNVVIHRLPKMLEADWRLECAAIMGESESEAAPPPRYNLMVPASCCPHCQAPIRAWQNIPLLSYLWLRGRCANCGGRISPRYPLVELATGLLFGVLAVHFGPTPALLGGLLLTAVLVALTGIDADTHLLPDNLTLPLLWAGLLFNMWSGRVLLDDAVLGAMAGYLVLWSVYWAFKLTTGKEGMGYGDFKLLAALGAWCGWQQILLILLLSSFVGAAVGIALMLMARHGRNQPLPYGPYLAAAGWIAYVWGEAIMKWYWHGA